MSFRYNNYVVPGWLFFWLIGVSNWWSKLRNKLNKIDWSKQIFDLVTRGIATSVDLSWITTYNHPFLRRPSYKEPDCWVWATLDLHYTSSDTTISTYPSVSMYNIDE